MQNEADGYGRLADGDQQVTISIDLSSTDSSALWKAILPLESAIRGALRDWLRDAAPAGTVTTEVTIST